MSSRELNGCMEALKTDRAVEELRRGRAIELIDGSKGWVIAAVETLEPSLLKQLKSLYNDKIKLLITLHCNTLKLLKSGLQIINFTFTPV